MTKPVHWLKTTVTRGTPIGTLACKTVVDENTVVTVYKLDVTCRRCKRTKAYKAAS